MVGEEDHAETDGVEEAVTDDEYGFTRGKWLFLALLLPPLVAALTVRANHPVFAIVGLTVGVCAGVLCLLNAIRLSRVLLAVIIYLPLIVALQIWVAVVINQMMFRDSL